MRLITITLLHCIKAVVLLFVIGLALEVSTRAFLPKSRMVPDHLLNHKYRANSIFEEDGCVRTTDPHGWMTTEDVTTRKPNDFLLFTFGDSFTAGFCQTDVARVIAEKLKPSFAEIGKNLRVVNVGTPSYSPALFRLQYIHHVRQYRPNAILINVDMTDVFDDTIARQIAVYQQGKIVAIPRGTDRSRDYLRTSSGLIERPWILKALFDLASYSDAAARFSSAIDAAYYTYQPAQEQELEDNRRSYAWCEHTWHEQTQEDVQWSMNQLREFIDAAQQDGVEVYVSAVPHLEHFLGTYSRKPFEAVKLTVEQAGARFIDSFSPLAEKWADLDPRGFYILDDIHLNPDGTREWGQIEAETLRQMLNVGDKKSNTEGLL